MKNIRSLAGMTAVKFSHFCCLRNAGCIGVGFWPQGIRDTGSLSQLRPTGAPDFTAELILWLEGTGHQKVAECQEQKALGVPCYSIPFLRAGTMNVRESWQPELVQEAGPEPGAWGSLNHTAHPPRTGLKVLLLSAEPFSRPGETTKKPSSFIYNSPGAICRQVSSQPTDAG